MKAMGLSQPSATGLRHWLTQSSAAANTWCKGEKRGGPFTNKEEEEVHTTDVVPYLLETALREHGALHHEAPNWSENVVTDGRLITGAESRFSARCRCGAVKCPPLANLIHTSVFHRYSPSLAGLRQQRSGHFFQELNMKTLPPVALGTWSWGTGFAGGDTVFGNHLSDTQMADVFTTAMSKGLNLWDTAAVYGMGSSEAALGTLVRQFPREDMILSTKFTPQIANEQSAQPASDMLEASLGRLGVDAIDIYSDP